jgi:flagellar FliL protein
MYLFAFLYIPLSLLIVILPTVIIANKVEPEQALSTPLYIALFLFISLKAIVAIFSDSLYSHHSKNKIRELDSQYQDKVIQRQKIKQAGGTNITLPIILLALPLLISAVLIIFASVQLFDVVVKKDDSVTTQSAKIITDQQTATTPKSYHVVLKDITTNLATKNKIIVLGLYFELDNQKAVTEFQDLEIKIKSVITQTLADLTVEQVTGSAGQDALTSMLMNKINAFMMEGKVTEINIPNIITQ